MRTLEATELHGQFKAVVDMAISGEPVLVSMPSRQNVVVLSEGEYQGMVRAQRIAEYLTKVEKESKAHTNRAAEVFGLGKGQVWMSDDFDAPLEDFAEYM